MQLTKENLIDDILPHGGRAQGSYGTRRSERAGAESEIATLKSKLKRIWMAGDYDRFSRPLERGAWEFYQRLGVTPGARLLDVACGSGQLALIAARAGAVVTGIDIAPNLVERARIRARADLLPARFEEGDAEALRFPDSSFEVVTSLIGAMFAPRPELVAHELLRVCRPGGMIAMANWTREGFIGRLFQTISKFIAPSGMPAPVLWGDEAAVRERFGAGVSRLQLKRNHVTLDYPFPPAEVVRFFRLNYGPANRAFASLDRQGRKELHREMEALWSSNNLAGDGVTKVEAEWLEVIATRA
jgi:SAM-dependent methyltransferase